MGPAPGVTGVDSLASEREKNLSERDDRARVALTMADGAVVPSVAHAAYMKAVEADDPTLRLRALAGAMPLQLPMPRVESGLYVLALIGLVGCLIAAAVVLLTLGPSPLTIFYALAITLNGVVWYALFEAIARALELLLRIDTHVRWLCLKKAQEPTANV